MGGTPIVDDPALAPELPGTRFPTSAERNSFPPNEWGTLTQILSNRGAKCLHYALYY